MSFVKYTEAEVEAQTRRARRLQAEGHTTREIARIMGVGNNTILESLHGTRRLRLKNPAERPETYQRIRNVSPAQRADIVGFIRSGASQQMAMVRYSVTRWIVERIVREAKADGALPRKLPRPKLIMTDFTHAGVKLRKRILREKAEAKAPPPPVWTAERIERFAVLRSRTRFVPDYVAEDLARLPGAPIRAADVVARVQSL